MRRHGYPFALLIGLLAAVPRTGRAQALLENLRNLGRSAGEAYLEPGASSLGAIMTTGWFYQPPKPRKMDIDFDFGLVTLGGLYFGAPEYFNTDGTFTFGSGQANTLAQAAFLALSQDPRVAALSDAQRQALRDTLAGRLSGREVPVGLRGPTSIGPSGDSLFVGFRGADVDLSVPASGANPGFDTTLTVAPREIGVPIGSTLGDLPFLPNFAPQIAIGTVYGTRLALRWLPKMQIVEDLGDVGVFGFGLQHNFAVWFHENAPLDLTFDLHAEWVDVENTFTSSAWAGGLVASKTFGGMVLAVTPFAGLYLETSTTDVDYEYTVDTPAGEVRRTAEYSIDGQNDYHASLGLAAKIFFLALAGEYNFAEYQSFSATVMIML